PSPGGNRNDDRDRHPQHPGGNPRRRSSARADAPSGPRRRRGPDRCPAAALRRAPRRGARIPRRRRDPGAPRALGARRVNRDVAATRPDLPSSTLGGPSPTVAGSPVARRSVAAVWPIVAAFIVFVAVWKIAALVAGLGFILPAPEVVGA